PSLKVLRDARPDAHIEILGYKHIAALAENRFYAQAVRSIEYASLSSFFAKKSALAKELADYFSNFDLIVSYLYDPDRIFEENLRRCGVANLLRGPAKILESAGHAARQLTRPIEDLGVKVRDLTVRDFPSIDDRHFAREFLGPEQQPLIAIHPGSGGTEKNWPLGNWIALFSRHAGFSFTEEKSFSLLVVSGEADEAQTEQLERAWKNRRVRFVKNLPLPHLAAVLERSIFIGHDSGISHLAAAAGANCTLLFGPTDPNVWAPQNNNVRILTAPNGRLSDLTIKQVEAAVADALRSH